MQLLMCNTRTHVCVCVCVCVCERVTSWLPWHPVLLHCVFPVRYAVVEETTFRRICEIAKRDC